MRKIIAVTGPHNARTREVVSILLAELQLLHINMRQPIVDFSAKCLGVDPFQLDHHVPLHQYYEEIQMNLKEMQAVVQTFLCITNKCFLLDYAECEMGKAEFLLDHGSKGFIVSNITAESEATWARNQGGILIHVEDRDSLGTSIPLQQHAGDELIITCRETPPSAENLGGIIKKLADHFGIDTVQKAA